MHILIADDHDLFRDGVCHLLQQLDDITILEACNRAEIDVHLEESPLDILLLDLAMPGVESVHAVKEICKAAPTVAVIVLSGNDTPHVVSSCLSAGALGFISKSSSTSVMLAAIQSVYAGEVYTPLDMPDHIQETITLSPRQQEVLTLMIKGHSNKSISHLLCITESTVKQHISEVFRKLGASNRAQAIQKANAIHFTLS